MKTLFFLLFLLILPLPAISQDKEDKPVDVPFSDMECAAAYEVQKKELAVRAEELDRREEMLKDLEKQLDEKISKWNALQKDLERKLSRFQEKTDKDFENLVEVYSTMRGSKAAPLLNGMSSKNAARILKEMDSEKVADIVPRLDGEKAVEVSRLMGRLN